MIDALRAYLHGAGAALLGPRSDAPLRILKSSGARAISASIKFFVFCGADAEPHLVCRVARHVRGEQRLQQEWQVRHDIDSRLPERLRRTLPKALALERLAGHLMLIEAGLPGCALDGPWTWRLGRRQRRVARDLVRVQRWLAHFHDATVCDDRPWEAADEEAYLTQFFANVGRWFQPGAGPDVEALLRRGLQPLRGTPIRWAAQHGDFWHGNVLAGADGLGVVDWEVARRQGPGFVDPLTFAFQYLFWQAHDNGARTTEVPDWLHQAVLAFVHRALGPLATDAAQLDAAFLVTLLARCQLGGYGEGPPVALRVLLGALRAPQSLDWLRG
jgi:hypothetical protein